MFQTEQKHQSYKHKHNWNGGVKRTTVGTSVPSNSKLNEGKIEGETKNQQLENG